MSVQFIRKSTLLFSISNGQDNDVLDLSELHFTFTVQAFIVSTPKNMQMRIYNPKPSTVKKILEEGSSVTLSAGYEGSFGKIFKGAIIQKRVGRESSTDTYLDISAVDGDGILNNAFASVSIPAGSNAYARLNTIGKNAGFTINHNDISKAGTTLSRGKVCFGLARDQLRTICATEGADWSINNGMIDVIAQSAYRDGDTVVLNSATGLIGFPTQTYEGISFRCLLNPAIQQGSKVQIDNANIQQLAVDLGFTAVASNAYIPSLSADGVYKILYITTSGDTRGDAWYTDGVGYAGENTTSPSQMQYAPQLYKEKLY